MIYDIDLDPGVFQIEIDFHIRYQFQLLDFKLKFNLKKKTFLILVPILPDYLSHLNYDGFVTVPNSLVYKSFDLHYVPTILGKHPLAGNSIINFTISTNKDKLLEELIAQDVQKDQKEHLGDENSSIGILLAAKALVQLIVTPIVGHLTLRYGYLLPVVFGTTCLLVASLGKCFRNYGNQNLEV